MSINSLYFNSPEYGDNISIDDVTLLSGFCHLLKLASVPVTDFSSFSIVCEKDYVSFADGYLKIDLTSVDEKNDFDVIFHSPFLEESGYSFHFHLLPRINLDSFVGKFVNSNNDKQVLIIEDQNKGSLDTQDFVDDLPILTFTYDFDYKSLEFVFNIPKFINEEKTEFCFFLKGIIPKTNNGLMLNLCLLAQNEGFTDSVYLLGDGDEDGIVGYDFFKSV